MHVQSMAGIMDVFGAFNLLLIAVGTAVGIVFGAVPGLTAGMAVALCLPVTYGMNSVNSMCLLLGLYTGGVSGGLISAILLKIPGTPASVATVFDGYPMAARGEAGKAIATGIIYSFLGGLFSYAVLFLLSPQLSAIAIRFTPYDYFSVILFSLTLIAGLSSGSMAKGLLTGTLGIAFSLVGAAPIDGVPRYTFGMTSLDAGFVFLPVMVGIFAISQILAAAEDSVKPEESVTIISKISKMRFSWREFKGQFGNFFISSLIGTGIGILPGIGGGTSNLIAYTVARNRSKYPEKFGTGIMDGIVASETANNATIGGAMVPLLSLGIPGDAVTAILIGAFMIHGISPGPLMFTTNRHLVYAIFAALIVSNIMMVILEFGFIGVFVQFLKIPAKMLLPMILAVCAIGAIGANNRTFDVYIILAFGLVGYAVKKFRYPAAPMVMGFVLGPILELNLRRALMFSKGELKPFFTNPISCTMLIITALSIGWTVYKELKARANPGRPRAFLGEG